MAFLGAGAVTVGVGWAPSWLSRRLARSRMPWLAAVVIELAVAGVGLALTLPIILSPAATAMVTNWAIDQVFTGIWIMTLTIVDFIPPVVVILLLLDPSRRYFAAVGPRWAEALRATVRVAAAGATATPATSRPG